MTPVLNQSMPNKTITQPKSQVSSLCFAKNIVAIFYTNTTFIIYT